MMGFLKRALGVPAIGSEMAPYDAHALRLLLGKFNRRDLRILEIGSWSGRGSTTIFADYAARIVCVDHWKGNENAVHQRLARETNPFEEFKKNTQPFSEKIIAVHTHSKAVAGLFAPESFDLVFIDGDHRYEQTKNDINNTIHLVAKGGVLCGHDCEGRPTPENIAILRSNMANDHCPSSFRDFKEMHPGVILAVDELVKGVSLFAEEPFEIPIRGIPRRGYSSIWYKQIQ